MHTERSKLLTNQRDPLFPLFRSRLMTDVATTVFFDDDGLTIQQLSDHLDVDRKNVTEVVDTLVDAGVFSQRRIGRSRLLNANTDAPFYMPLLQLLTIVQGPPRVIASTLRNIPGVQGAYIYGSWAARTSGIPGGAPKDVDVLIITAERATSKLRVQVLESLDQAADTLKRPVNPTIVTIDQWMHVSDPFLDDLRNEPLVEALPMREPVAT